MQYIIEFLSIYQKATSLVVRKFLENMAKFKEILKEYLLNATFHGAKFIISTEYHPFER